MDPRRSLVLTRSHHTRQAHLLELTRRLGSDDSAGVTVLRVLATVTVVLLSRRRFEGEEAVELVVDQFQSLSGGSLSRTIGWLPGGLAARLTCYAAVTILGVLLGGWAHTRRKSSEGGSDLTPLPRQPRRHQHTYASLSAKDGV